MTEFLMHLL